VDLGYEDGVDLEDEDVVDLEDEDGVDLGDEDGVDLWDEDDVDLGDEDGVDLEDKGVDLEDEDGEDLGDGDGVDLGDRDGVDLGDGDGVDLGDDVDLGDEDGDDPHLEPLGGLEELRQLILRHVHLAGVHELQDRRQVLEGHVLEDDDGVLGWVLLEQRLEVGRAGGQDHLVRLAALPVRGDRHVRERLLVPKVLE